MEWCGNGGYQKRARLSNRLDEMKNDVDLYYCMDILACLHLSGVVKAFLYFYNWILGT